MNRAIRLLSYAVAGLVSLIPLSALSQTTQTTVPERIVLAVDNTQRITLAGSLSPRLAHASDLGAISPSQKLNRIVLVLKRTNAQQNDLDALVAAQHQQGNPQFHKWLTPEQFTARFAPAASDLTKVTDWLKSQGFSDITVARGGQRIEFSGAVASVESAFGSSMHQYSVKTATGTEMHTANATPISIPAALAPLVHGVMSLNDFTSKPEHVIAGLAKRDSSGKLTRVSTSAPISTATPYVTATDGNGDYAYYLGPADLKTIYGGNALPASVTGAGVAISIIGRSNIQLSDIQGYKQIFGLPSNDPNIIISGPDPGTESYGDLGESSLDLEIAGAIAPGATLNFVIASSTDTTDGIDLAAAYAVENVVSPIITVSYGSCEQDLTPSGNAFINSLWEQAAAEGISVFVATGDAGAATCDAGNSGPVTDGPSVNGLASTPYNVAVGGTQFAESPAYNAYWNSNNTATLESAIGYIPEGVWNDSCDPTLPSGTYNCNYSQSYNNIEGGGGGASSCAFGTVNSSGDVNCTSGYPKPAWQKGTGVPADNVRDIPDVALNASPEDDPYVACILASCEYTISGSQVSISQVSLAGGTSASTPLMAGIMALVEQQNGTFLGLPNYNLYALANQAATSCSSSGRTDPTQSASCIFNDVTAGNNGVPGLPGWGTATPDYTATAGYDLASGWGSVNIANLVNDWKNGDASSVTTTTLTAASTTAAHGQPISVNVKVASTAGTPTGDIALMTDKYGAAGTYTLTSGAWSGNVSNLPGGTYNLTAHYAGDSTFSFSTSSTTSITITPESSTAALNVETLNFFTGTLAAVSGPNQYGTDIYFKGTVAGTSGQGTPTGTVTILADGATTLATTTLTADGGYLLDSTAVPVGTHQITVKYSGDNSFNASTSAATSIAITQGASETEVSIYGVPAVGSTAPLAVTVAGTGPALPTGTVQFYDNNVAIGSPQTIVYNGLQGSGYSQASIQYTYTTSGQHVLTATYSGDANYLPVTLTGGYNITRTITLGGTTGNTPTTTTITMTSGTTLTPGQDLRFLISVKSGSSSVTTVPSGSVYAIDSTGVVQYVNPMSGGVLNGDIFVYAPGTYTLHAYYPGDATFAPSTSSTSITYTVSQLTPTVTFAAGTAYTLPNTQSTLNYRTYPTQVNAYVQEAGTGTVSFTDSLNGAAPAALGTFALIEVQGNIGGYSGRFVLPIGTNVITATYSGNGVFSSATSQTTVVVGNPDFAIVSTPASLTIQAGTTGTASLTLTPMLNYTGSVALACASGVPVGSTCTVTPTSGTFGSAITATISIATVAPSNTVAQNTPLMRPVIITTFAGILFLFLVPGVSSRRRLTYAMLPVLLVAALFSTVTGCSSSPSAPGSTLISVSSSHIKAASGAVVSFTATLSSLKSNPTGTVTFYDGTTAIGTGTVSNDAASLQASSLAVGSHTITATYGGDSNNVTSSSAAITQVVTGTTNVVISAASGSLSHTITLPVTLQ